MSWFHHKLLLTHSFFSLVSFNARGCGLDVTSLLCLSTPCPSSSPLLLTPVLLLSFAQRRPFRRDEHSELWNSVLRVVYDGPGLARALQKACAAYG
jgi:hypothetical protein